MVKTQLRGVDFIDPVYRLPPETLAWRAHLPIGIHTPRATGSAGGTPQMHLEHIQRKVITVTWLRLRTIVVPAPKVAVLILDADFDFGQRHRPEVRDEDAIAKRPHSRNRNRLNLLDQ
jgi:hypothetical protein